MDKLNRLTKISEWKLGSYYRCKKGKVVSGPPYRCVQIDHKLDVVYVVKPGDACPIFLSCWHNRYIKVMAPEKT